GVKPGNEGNRAEAPPLGVDPEGCFGRDETQPMMRVPGRRMVNARRIVPHLVEVCQLAAQRCHGVMHLAISSRVGTVEDCLWWKSRGRMPVTADSFQAAHDAPRGDDGVRGMESKLSTRGLIGPGTSANAAAARQELIHPMLMVQLEFLAVRMIQQPVAHGLD